MSLFPSGNEPVSNLRDLRPVFLTIHVIGGQVGLPLLVLTYLFSSKIARHPTLINFCFTWIIFSIVYCLSLYDGSSNFTNALPSRLCIVQSALIHGVSPMAAMAGLVLMLHIFFTFQRPCQTYSERVPRSVHLCFLLSPPYIALIVFSVVAGVIALNHPGSITSANGLYCTMGLDPFNRLVVPLAVLATMAITMGFEVAIAAQFVRQWSNIKKTFPLADRQTDMSLCFRIFIFSVYSWVTLAACVLFLSESSSAFRHMVPTALPLVAFMIFSTQKDLFKVWFCWLGQPHAMEPTDSLMPSARPFCDESSNPDLHPHTTIDFHSQRSSTQETLEAYS